MRYWSSTRPAIPEQSGDSYLLFEPDIGGLNNIRIGWEAAGYAAAASGRTLVLPPGKQWYLLDTPSTESHVEDFITLQQLQNGLSALTFDDFVQKEQAELERRGFASKVPSYSGGSNANAGQAYKEW